MDIRLELIEGSNKEALIGIEPNACEIDQGIIDAVRSNRRLIPHIITHLAGNIAVNSTECLPAMIEVRNKLVEALREDS